MIQHGCGSSDSNGDGDGSGYGDGCGDSRVYDNGRGYGYEDGYGYGDAYSYGCGEGADLGLKFEVIVEEDGMIAIGCETKPAQEWLHGDHSDLVERHSIAEDEVSALRRYVEQLARWL